VVEEMGGTEKETLAIERNIIKCPGHDIL